MIARIVSILVMLVTLAPMHTPLAEASVEPGFAANTFFSALNAGNGEAAVAAFTPDATATLARGATYHGQADLADLIELMGHAGRHYEIVQANVADDTLILNVEVSDQGIRWGEATYVAQIQGGKLQTLHETAFRLRLGA